MAGFVLLSMTLGTTLSRHASASSPEQNFEPQCQSETDYGWPRFESLAELQASPWASYFANVYGELPSRFPVCIYDLWAIDKESYLKANITGREVVQADKVQEGDLFEGGLMGYQIYHGRYEPLPENTWVEVTHTVFPTELKGFWVWRQRGSGIWYNTGKTKVFPTPADPSKIHAEAIAFLTANCSKTPTPMWPQLESDIFGFCAREKGYDSIQFEPQAGQTRLGTFGLTGLTEMVLVNLDGDHNCGVTDASQTLLRGGWMASQKCDCKNEAIADSCGLMPRAPFPFSITGAKPALCKIQEGFFWNRWRACDPSTCHKTTCRLRNHRAIKTVVDESLNIGTNFVTV